MRHLSSYIKSSTSKTMFKNGNRYECGKTEWTDKTLYTITIFNNAGKCLHNFATEDKDEANNYYLAH